MLRKLKSWINRENKPGTPLWKALLFEHRLPLRYRNNRFPFYHLAGRAIGIGAKQKEKELSGLINLLKKKTLQTVLEIGTAEGGTLYCWSKLATKDAVIISVDSNPKYKVFLDYGTKKQKLHLLKKDSHDKSTKDLIKKILNGSRLDFFFIDGDHRYEGVKMDFNLYYDLVIPNGIIALHDICRYGVYNFWNEIKNNFRNIEIIDKNNKLYSALGIGIIIKSV